MESKACNNHLLPSTGLSWNALWKTKILWSSQMEGPYLTITRTLPSSSKLAFSILLTDEREL